MTDHSQINPGQLKALHALWHQYAAHLILGAGTDERGSRLQFAREVLGREIESFNALTKIEASALLDALQRSLGREPRSKPMRDRYRAQRAGTAGRKGASTAVTDLAEQTDLDRINGALTRLGWDQARFQAWLRSPSSPLKGSAPQVRTVAEANRVWWALKRMAGKVAR